MKRSNSFFSFSVKKQNLDEFDKAAIRCGMNPDEYGEVIKKSDRQWYAYLDNGKEVAQWISYNGHLCFAGLCNAKDYATGGRSLYN